MRKLIFLLFFSTFVFSQVATDTRYHGARQLALAGSDIAWQQDEFAVFHNPAAGAWLSKSSVGLSYEKLFGLSYLPHVSTVVSSPIGSFGTTSLSYEQMSVSYQSRLLSNEMAVGLSQAFFLQKDRNSTLSMGFTASYYSVDYGKSAGPTGDGSDGIELGSHQTFGLSVGVQASLHETHWVGASVKNINSPRLGQANMVSYLPRSIAVGYSYVPYHLVKTHFAMTHALGKVSQYHAGLEYQLLSSLQIFSGVHSNPNRLGLGIRLNVKLMKIDYALLTHPILPISQQFTFGMAF